MTHPDVQVITGVDANHMVITEPLVEVIPEASADMATLHVAFQGNGDEPVMLGIEGAIALVTAFAPEGDVVMYRVVDMNGDSVDLPAGDYVLRASYRPCANGRGVSVGTSRGSSRRSPCE